MSYYQNDPEKKYDNSENDFSTIVLQAIAGIIIIAAVIFAAYHQCNQWSPNNEQEIKPEQNKKTDNTLHTVSKVILYPVEEKSQRRKDLLQLGS